VGVVLASWILCPFTSLPLTLCLISAMRSVTIQSGRFLDSAVMTMRAESRISHGLLVIVSWITDQSADVALVSIVLVYHMPKDMTHS
jgi:hypothetical protein